MNMESVVSARLLRMKPKAMAMASPTKGKKAKKAILQAFRNQIDGKGFSFVELLSTCPTNWHMSPVKALDYVKNEMTAQYPLGVFKEVK